MEKFDASREKALWQRVRGQTGGEGLQALAAAERTAAAVYLLLSRGAQGRKKELLRQLYHRERTHSRYLNGVSVLRDGQALSARGAPPECRTAENTLRRCYAGCLKAAAEYESLAGDGEYGAVFSRMAREERENCVMILEILGQ